MLNLDAPLEAGGLSLYGDHSRQGAFYYLPTAPRCRPQLLKYRGANQGGLLFLEVELGPGEDELRAAHDALRERTGAAPVLMPALFDDGAARLTALDVVQGTGAEAPSFLVEKILGSAKPSLLGRHRALFTVELDREGATLIDAALRTGFLPVIVQYDLAFTGLRPARGVQAVVRFSQAYDYLRARGTLASLWFKADLDREAEALEKKGFIEIKDVDYLGSDPAVLAERRKEILATLAELVQTIFFRPSASPQALSPDTLARQPALDSVWARANRASAAFCLRDLRQRETAELTYDFSEARPSTVRIAPQGALRLPPGADPARAIVEVDTPTQAPTQEVRVFVDEAADWTGVDRLEAEIRQGAESRSAVLSKTAPTAVVTIPSGPLEYRVRAFAAIEPEAVGRPLEPDSAFRPLTSRSLDLEPARIAGRRTLEIAAAAVDFSLVRGIDVRLRCAGREQTFLLTAARPSAQVPVWGAEPAAIEAKFDLAAGEPHLERRTLEPAARHVLLSLPPARFQQVTVVLHDPLERYQSVIADLEAAGGGQRRSIELTAQSPTAVWTALRGAASDGSFRYRVRKLGRDASVEDENWTAAAGPLLLVGDRDVRLETVSGFLLGVEDSLGALLRFAPLAPPSGAASPVEVMLDPGQADFRVRLPFRRDAARRYRVEGEVFRAEDTIAIPAREETAEVLLLVVAGGA